MYRINMIHASRIQDGASYYFTYAVFSTRGVADSRFYTIEFEIVSDEGTYITIGAKQLWQLCIKNEVHYCLEDKMNECFICCIASELAVRLKNSIHYIGEYDSAGLDFNFKSSARHSGSVIKFFDAERYGYTLMRGYKYCIEAHKVIEDSNRCEVWVGESDFMKVTGDNYSTHTPPNIIDEYFQSPDDFRFKDDLLISWSKSEGYTPATCICFKVDYRFLIEVM